MSRLHELLHELLQRGVELWADGDRLRFRAEPGALDEAARRMLRTHRAEVVRRLGQRRRHAAATFAQERLWFVEQLDPGTGAFNMPWLFRLRGPLDRGALVAAWREIVRRHDSLRTSLAAFDGRAVQVVAEGPAPAIGAVDLAGLSPAVAAILGGRLAGEEARRPVPITDPATDPIIDPRPFRILLVRLAASDHLLCLTLHHAVSDARSQDVFVRELGILYEHAALGRPSPLRPLPVQVTDAARRQLCGEAAHRARLAGWKDRLRGLEDLALPFDRPRRIPRDSRGATLGVTLPSELVAALRRRGAASRCSLFMTLLAGFQALLGRISGQHDFATGSPVGGRPPETEGLIGFFVNNLVLRARLGGRPSFAELLDRTRDTVLGALAHQDLPFERLVAELEPERDLGRHPLFQVVFNLRGAAPRFDRHGLALRVEAPAVQAVRFDLVLHLWEEGGGLHGLWLYATQLFDATTIRRLAARLPRLLRAAADAPDVAVDQLPLLAPAERHQLLVEWNTSADDPPASGPPWLHERFLARASRAPEATALVLGETALSYGELARRSGELAARLRGRGAGPESVVAVCRERSLDWAIATLAIWRAGAACLALDPRDPPRRLRRLTAAAGARLVIATRAEDRRFGTRVEALLLDEPAPGDVAPTNVPLRGEEAAAVIFTSGSTGRPKAVVNTHRGLAHRVAWGQRAYPLSAGDAVLQLASPSFDFALWELAAPLAAGARVELVAPGVAEDSERLVELLARSRVTVAHFVPSLLAALLEVPGFARCTALRRVFCGGEALPDELAGRAVATLSGAALSGAALANQYGPTEASIDVTYHRVTPGPPKAGSVPIGRPMAGHRIVLVDRRLEPVPLGSAGELAIGGVGLARGYRGRPRRTAEAWLPDPWAGRPGERLYLSGDRARQLATGVIDFVGRLDGQVKIRGFRVELGEIEGRLLEHPAVAAAAAAVATGDDSAGRRLVAAAVPKAGVEVEPEELRRALGETLPDFMVPAALAVVGELPRTARGKIDRQAVAAAVRPGGRGASTPPRDPIEALVAEVWRDVLGVPVGVHDDFFALGGHSLLATRVASRIRRGLSVELPVRTLFEDRTIAALARRLGRSRSTDRGEPDRIEPRPSPTRPSRLSFGQERLWFLDQVEARSAAYNVPSVLRLEGELDVAALAGACRELVRRHEVLRTHYRTVAGRPRQVVDPLPESVLSVVDLGSLPTPVRSGVARELARHQAARPFHLAAGPVLRIVLLRQAARRHQLLWTVHHVASDAGSSGVWRRELSTLYAARSAGRPSPLPEPRIQYADFAAWQRRALRGEVLERQLAYWRRQLADLPGVELATDRPRPPAPTFRGASARLALAPATTAACRATARQAGASLYMVLLAGFLALVHRHTGRRDLAVGSPIANRQRAEIEDLVGFFVNTLVLRGDLSPPEPGRDLAFGELLARVRETALAAYTHQDLPFEKLVEALAPPRDLSRHPLFQWLLTLHPPGRAPLRLPGVEVTELEPEHPVARFDLEWHLWEEASDGSLQGRVIFAADLFDATTVARLARHYQRLLAAAAQRPELALPELPLLSAAERHQLLREWGEGDGGRPAGDLLSGWAASAERSPEAVAVESGVEHLSYRELDRRARRLAGRLRQLGVGPETVVAVATERSAALPTAVLAVLMAGGAYLPLDPAHPAERSRALLRDAEARRVLADDGSARRLGELPATVLSVSSGSEARAGGSALPEPVPASPEHPAYLIYTSGSTGRPKGVVMRRGALARLLAWQLASPGFSPGLRTLQFASLAFDVSFQEMLSTWGSGGTLVLVPEARRRDLAALWELLVERRIERLFVPFVVLEQLAEIAGLPNRVAPFPAPFPNRVAPFPAPFPNRVAPRSRAPLPNRVAPRSAPFPNRVAPRSAPLPNRVAPRSRAPLPNRVAPRSAPLREVVTAGEQLRVTPAIRWLFAACGATLMNHYGPSETHVVTAGEVAGSPSSWPALPSIGRPISGTRAALVDAALRPVAIGVPGQLMIGGASLARGYHRRPGLTAERFVPAANGPAAGGPPGARLYASGDLARHLADGRLEFLGRLDRQVKVRGVRVEPGEVEAALEGLPEVRHALVFAEGSSGGHAADRHLVGVLVPSPGAELPDEAVLRERLRELLPEALVPAAFRILPELPLTATGKVDRAAAERLAASATPAIEPDVAPPRGAVEQNLAEIFAELLGRERVGVHDDFFALGGHSLLAVRLAVAVERRFGVRLPLASFFRASTVESLARHLPRVSPSPPASPLVEIREGVGTPLYLVHPAGGHVLCYRALARHLDDRPVFGLEARPGESAPRIEDMASSYLAALREHRPGGPYHLCGWSLGGLVAYEMARQATATGLAVDFLGLIDTHVLRPHPDPAEDAADLLGGFARDLGLPRGAERSSLEAILTAARAAGLLGSGADLTELRRLFERFQANVEAGRRYAPRPYSGGLTFFRATDRRPGEARDPVETWRELAEGEVQIVKVPGDHFSMMREPRCRVLGRELDRRGPASPFDKGD